MKKIDLNKCKLADIKAAGLEENIFANPVALEAYIWENSCRIFTDWKEAREKIENMPEMTFEEVEKYISDLSAHIYHSFWDVEGEI